MAYTPSSKRLLLERLAGGAPPSSSPMSTDVATEAAGTPAANFLPLPLFEPEPVGTAAESLARAQCASGGYFFKGSAVGQRPTALIAASERGACTAWARSRATPERTRTTWSWTRRTWPGAQPHVFLLKNTAAPCAWNVILNFSRHDLRFRHVFSLPDAALQLLSQLPNLHAQVKLPRLPRASLYLFYTSL